MYEAPKIHVMHDITAVLESRAMELKHSSREVDQNRVKQISIAICILGEQVIPNKGLLDIVKLDFPLGVLRQKRASLATDPKLNKTELDNFRHAIHVLENTEISTLEVKPPSIVKPKLDDDIMYQIPDGTVIVKGFRNDEYKHYSSCVSCELHKNNISSGSGACFECDHKDEPVRHIDHTPDHVLEYGQVPQSKPKKKEKLLRNNKEAGRMKRRAKK